MQNPIPWKKKRKFKELKCPRYLVGTLPLEMINRDLEEFNTFRKRLYYASSKVDNHPPKFNPFLYYNKNKLLNDVLELRSIDLQNKRLLDRINYINKFGGAVDSYNTKVYESMSKWAAQQDNMRKIEDINKKIYEDLIRSKSKYPVREMNNFWREAFRKIKLQCKFPFVIMKKQTVDDQFASCPSLTDNLNIDLKPEDRPLCFMEFSIKGGQYLGRIIIKLYHDCLPVTTENFMELCKGPDLTYKNCLVYRIKKCEYIETGDITHNTGRGGISIYGNTFPEENHVLSHSRAGVLSMLRVGNYENNSRFIITLSNQEHFDRRNVAFGKVVKGMDVLFTLQDFGRKIGRPTDDVIISNCGIIENPKILKKKKKISNCKKFKIALERDIAKREALAKLSTKTQSKASSKEAKSKKTSTIHTGQKTAMCSCKIKKRSSKC